MEYAGIILSINAGFEHKHDRSIMGLIALENEPVCCCQGRCLCAAFNGCINKPFLAIINSASKHNRNLLYMTT